MSLNTKHNNIYKIKNLKINNHLDNIVDTLINNNVIGIIAQTGTGKTSGIPPYIATKLKNTNIWITVPTRASTNVWKWVSQYYPELNFGFASNGIKRYNPKKTHVVYMTTGHMYLKLLNIIKKIKNNKSVILPKILMVDEVHNSSSENYLLLKLLKYMLKTFPKITPKLIVSSATFETEAFVFDFPKAKIINILTKNYHTNIEYLKEPILKKHYLLKIAARKACIIAKDLIINEKIGTILVFCSGKSEVEKVIDIIYENTDKSLKNVKVNALYSNLSQNEIDDALVEYIGVRIIISTNMTESSITIPNTVSIISTMYHNELQLDMNNKQILKECLISKSSAIQQKGRTGRTCVGECYRLCTENEYNNLEEYDTNDIHRIDIYKIVLNFISANISIEEIHDITELKKEKINIAIRRLVMLQMIKKKDDNKYDVTELGKFVSKLPVSPELGNVIYMVHIHKLYNPLFMLFVIISVSYVETCSSVKLLWYPRRKKDESNKEYTNRKNSIREHYHDKYKGRSDIETFINIHTMCENSVKKYKKNNKKLKLYNAYKRYSVKNYLNNKSIYSARELVKNIIKSCNINKIEVGKTLLKVDIPDEWWNDLYYLYTKAFNGKILHKYKPKKKKGSIYCTNIGDKYIIGNGKVFTTLIKTLHPKYIIALSYNIIESNKNRQQFAGIIFPPTIPSSNKLLVDLRNWMINIMNKDEYIFNFLKYIYNAKKKNI